MLTFERLDSLSAQDDFGGAKPAASNLRSQLRRRRAIQHVALGTDEQIERVSLDQKRTALARQLGDLFDARKIVFQEELRARLDLIDIEQWPRQFRSTRL